MRPCLLREFSGGSILEQFELWGLPGRLIVWFRGFPYAIEGKAPASRDSLLNILILNNLICHS